MSDLNSQRAVYTPLLGHYGALNNYLIVQYPVSSNCPAVWLPSPSCNLNLSCPVICIPQVVCDQVLVRTGRASGKAIGPQHPHFSISEGDESDTLRRTRYGTWALDTIFSLRICLHSRVVSTTEHSKPHGLPC
jgi:hypothetical protein